MESTTSQQLTCCIIEKAAVHRKLIRNYIDRIPLLKMSWEAEFQETSYSCFEKIVPDLIFMSLNQSSVELTPLLKPILIHHTGIIIITDYYMKETGIVSFPFISHLQKPFSFKEFTNSIEEYKRSLK